MKKVPLLIVAAAIVASLVAVYTIRQIYNGQASDIETAEIQNIDDDSSNAISETDSSGRRATPMEWVPIVEIGTVLDGYHDYFMQEGQIYYNSWIFFLIPKADAKSFMASGRNGSSFLAKDRNHVYANGRVIPDANPNSFVALHTPAGEYHGYAKDADHVWFFFGKELDKDAPYTIDADPDSFESVDPEDGCYINSECFDAQDKNRRYFGGNPILWKR